MGSFEIKSKWWSKSYSGEIGHEYPPDTEHEEMVLLPAIVIILRFGSCWQLRLQARLPVRQCLCAGEDMTIDKVRESV